MADHTVSNRQNFRSEGGEFDILRWYPKYQSCQRYFLDHAQHDVLVQAVASFVNILLPFQRQPQHALFDSRGAQTAAERVQADGTARPPTFSHTDNEDAPSARAAVSTRSVSLVPYIRRLVATGMDVPQILHGFFGDDWVAGIGPQHEQERRNFLFAAKSGGWAVVKRDYDMPPMETIPFLRPLQDPTNAEIEAAERNWSEWLAMEDWMVGPRSPK